MEMLKKIYPAIGFLALAAGLCHGIDVAAELGHAQMGGAAFGAALAMAFIRF